jgi:hypothetical protein
MEQMKNIHLIPTDNPSRLHLGKSGLVLCDFVFDKSTINGQHIYITSDEEIKEEDWVTNFWDILKPSYLPEYGLEYANKYWEKIILTTDQDLIKDGVQAIDNEFLEWFVKNPSCESVDVKSESSRKFGMWKPECYPQIYKIIIPQEESKQEDENYLDSFGVTKSEFETFRKFNKQETFEEAAEKYLDRTYNLSYEKTTWQKLHEKTFIAGAKWQAERMYTEEEVLKLLRKSHFVEQNIEEWFEQFKKK